MAHIPLGYKIVDGCAVVDEPTVWQIKETYRYYFEGKSLVDAAKEAGFKMNHTKTVVHAGAGRTSSQGTP